MLILYIYITLNINILQINLLLAINETNYKLKLTK